MVKYTDKQKAAYYKRKAGMVSRPTKRGRPYGSKSPRTYNKRHSKYNYPGVGRYLGSMAGSAIGNAIMPGAGGAIGGALGAVAGQGAHALVKRISGFGDYHVSRNALVYNKDAVPEFSSNNERCTMIVHREFIQDIIGSTTFNINSFRINPGFVKTFPWLSSIAENYEQYVIQGMVFEFKTTCANAVASTNTALGTVVMATQYNSLASNFTSKQQMENYEFSQSSTPSNSILHPIECDPTQTQCGGIFNVTDQVLDNTGDIRLYDIGRFSIATVGMQAAATIGELWVSYKICFLKPKLVSVSESADYYRQTSPNTISPTAPVGTYTTLQAFSANSGVVIPITDTDFDVSTNFVGVLQCAITYEIGSGITAFSTGHFNAFGGSGTTDVTQALVAISPSSKMSTAILTNANDVVTVIQYFRFEGGPDSSGYTPYILLTPPSMTGSGFNACTISFNSIDSSFYEFTA